MSTVLVTLGIDLSATEAKTAACAIRWEDGRATVDVPRRGLSNDDLRGLMPDAAATGIDAPLSWPVPFREALVEHGTTGGWPADHRSLRYQLRATDLFVDGIARRPLSVSTDRIGVTAMRCARLLQELLVETFAAATTEWLDFPGAVRKECVARDVRRGWRRARRPASRSCSWRSGSMDTAPG